VAFSSYHIRDSATIAGYLERFLREKMGGAWEVINMACPSGTSHMSVAVLAHEGIRFAPDVVVALNGNNDVTASNPANPEGPRFSHVYWSPIAARMARLYDPRTGRGQLRDNVAMVLAESAFYRRLVPTQRLWSAPAAWPDRIPPGRVDDFVGNTEALHFIAKGAGAKFTHFLQPYLSREHNTMGAREQQLIRDNETAKGQGFFRLLDNEFPVLAERVQTAARTHGFLAVDLSHFFTEEGVFGDHVHFIEKDADESVYNRRLALVMAEAIVAEAKGASQKTR
jgi:hypothetical protein